MEPGKSSFEKHSQKQRTIRNTVFMKQSTMTKTTVQDTPITAINLDVTNDCILRCDYCFKGKKDKQKLSWNVAAKTMDFLIRHSQDQRDLQVALFGGEPLMEFDLIKKLVPYAEQKAAYYGKKIHFSVTTNCVLVNDQIISFFRRHQMKFHTSIDGGPESNDRHRRFPDGRGTSAIIEPKIKEILKCWPAVVARTTVSNDTVHRWMEDTLYLAELGYKNLAMIPAPECDWTDRQWGYMRRELRKMSDFYIARFRTGKPLYIKHIDDGVKSIVKPSRQKYHCGAGRGYLAIKTDGAIYPCSRFAGRIDAQSGNHWQLGSVFEGIDQAKRKIFLAFDCVSDTKADCENCLAVHACGIGCIAVNWAHARDIAKPHPNHCKFKNMSFAEAVRIHYILKSEKNPLFMQRFYSKAQASQSQNNGKAGPKKCTAHNLI
jgi:uncharacterized protein